MSAHTPGSWFVSGVRFRMNGGEWHSVNHYDEELKRDENIACVGFDPRTGKGLSDARLIAAAPELLEALKLARSELNGLPHSLGYEFTHIPKIDAAIAKAIGETP